MINNLILVGRLADDPKFKQINENMRVCNIVLAVNRPFKDMDTGEYGVDYIPISLWNGISYVAADYCSKGDTIGIKGRVAVRCKEEDGINKYFLEVIGERISFISSVQPKDGLKMNYEEYTADDVVNDSVDDE